MLIWIAGLDEKLGAAALQGDAAGVREWLEAGADPNARNARNGGTAMHHAAAGGKSVEVLEVLEVLLGAGAEVDKLDEDGETPLMWAASNGATGAVLRWLLEHGADWRLQATSGDYAGKTALGIAKRQGKAEAASVLAAWVSEHGSAEETEEAAAVAAAVAEQEAAAAQRHQIRVEEFKQLGGKIVVKDLEGSSYELQVKGTDLVRSVKAQLQDKHGLNPPPEQQRLIIAGKQLQDEAMLADYAIEEGSTLHLVLRPRAEQQQLTAETGGQITVKDLEGGSYELQVKGTDLVRSVKAQLQDVHGYPPPEQQRLIFDGKQLEDEAMLADHAMKEGSTLHVVLRHGILYNR
eukprot:COSAG06_NODE_5810_length_3261_cov_21.125000_1_plen_349_part_00